MIPQISFVSNFRRDHKNFGLLKTLYNFSLKVINRFIFFKILKCVIISVVDPRYLGDEKGYQYCFLPENTLLNLAKNEENGLQMNFVHEALEKGDECYGILYGDSLASYGWYSNKPTFVTFDSAENGKENLWLHFAADYIYMYNGYTHNHYRGQRLHAIGMTRALKDYLDRGFKGLVSFVEANNFASLNSCYRMGYKDLGKIYILRIFGKHLIFHSKSCSKYAFCLTTFARIEKGIEQQCSPQAH
jgi:hypothetical protein